MSSSKRPQIVVGIDVGQTCSGVAYSIGPDWCDPRQIQKWPSLHGIEVKDKVATRVGYGKGSGELRSWGEQCDWSQPEVEIREQFKLTLDRRWRDARGYTCDEARRWYSDYLRQLHREIEKHFDVHIPKWRELRVEYNFSTPTTWRDPAMIAGVEKTIKNSGFANSALATVRMSLTEAEAAAIEASTTNYNSGEVFLICDAGGGTTDVNILKVQSQQGKIELEPLDHVEGIAIGSTLIDNLMAQHIMERLALIEDKLSDEIYQAADDMLTGRFQTIKHSFPEPIVDYFELEVRALSGSQTYEEAGIFNSRMRVDREVLRNIFDEQVDRIFRLLDDRLTALQSSHPRETVAYIILSGGFGSSPYLLDKVKMRYESNFGYTSPNIANVHIMRIAEPQLAVTKGLVRERTQQLGSSTRAGQEAFKYRRCRNSYGVVVSVDYKEELHQGLTVTVNPITGKKTVEGLVDWFIKQGEIIDVEHGVQRQYGADLQETERGQQRHVRIVMAKVADQAPPRLFSQDSCEELVLVKYYLTENDMQLIKRRFTMAPSYWQAAFHFVVMVGPADLRFEIHGHNGLLSSDHDSLEVEFFDAPELSREQRSGNQQNGQPPQTQQNGHSLNGQQNGHHSQGQPNGHQQQSSAVSQIAQKSKALAASFKKNPFSKKKSQMFGSK